MADEKTTPERLEREVAELRGRLQELESRLRGPAGGRGPGAPDPVTQLALWDSEARFAAAFDFSPVSMTQTRLTDRTFVDVNATFLGETGYTREEVIGKTDEDLGLFADPAGRARMLQQMHATGTVVGVPILLRRRSGEVRNCLFSAAVIRLAGVPHALSYILDVTERERAEAELRRSEERFALAFQTSPYAITITRAADGRFVAVNEAFSTITGYTREEALADSSINLQLWARPDDRERVVATLRAGGVVSGEEFPFRVKGGGQIVGLFAGRLLHLGPDLCVLSSILDVTARRRADLERERLHAAIEQSAEMVVITDASGLIEYVNPAFEAVTGWTRAEVVGRTPVAAYLGDPGDPLVREIGAALAAGRAWQGRRVARRKDGTTYDEEMTISPVRDASGVVTGHVAVKRPR